MLWLCFEVSWWFVLVCVFCWSFVADVPTKFEGFFRKKNPEATTSTYTQWGYVRMTGDKNQLAQIDRMHEREYALKNKEEDHRHLEAKYALETERQQAEWQYVLEQDRLKRAYRLALFRWSLAVFLLLWTSLLLYQFKSRKMQAQLSNEWLMFDAKRIQGGEAA
ncbi:hypothetical protein GF380_01130 [Candidatus Uhrbacteria bacterium]|nr:hypothetical protein [Candidatus Uhrbacteria bacterium]